jgi:hypothetical protein
MVMNKISKNLFSYRKFTKRLIKLLRRKSMNFKKLSLAAALSIGIISVGSIAFAEECGCPKLQPCLPQAQAPACPTQPQYYTMPLSRDQASAKVLMQQNVRSSCMNYAPNADIIQRQVFAFPSIGRSDLVIPRSNNKMTQIGGWNESLALNTCPGDSLSLIPSYNNALTLAPEFDYRKGFTGAASPYCLGTCPPVTKQVTQGMKILRCTDPNMKSGPGVANPCPTGAAIPIIPCMPNCIPQCPTGGAVPINPCPEACPVQPAPGDPVILLPVNPCPPPPCPTGQAVPIVPVTPCNPCPVNPCPPPPCPTGQAVPIVPVIPCNPCPEVQKAPCFQPVLPCPGGGEIPMNAPNKTSMINNEVMVKYLHKNSVNDGEVLVNSTDEELPDVDEAKSDPNVTPASCNPCETNIPQLSMPIMQYQTGMACPVTTPPCPTAVALPIMGQTQVVPVSPCIPSAPQKRSGLRNWLGFTDNPEDRAYGNGWEEPGGSSKGGGGKSMRYYGGSTGAAAPMAGCPRILQTKSGLQIQKTFFAPVLTVPAPGNCPGDRIPTGGAASCPVESQYPDVTINTLASCDISTLTAQKVLAGYPDRTYKPDLPILRSEFASAVVGALNLENVPDFQQQIFKDVPMNHWANSDIDKAYNRGILAGYPNDSFRPNEAVTRAEALSALAKVIPGNMSTCEAQKILGAYCDGKDIPGWASIPVAEALNTGLIKNLPENNQVKPNQSASRAEVASMLKQLRMSLGLEPCLQKTGANCPTMTYQPQMVTTTIPTLKIKLHDLVSSRSSEVGKKIKGYIVEPAMIDGKFFPMGSEVRGQVVEIIRPGIGNPGGIRLGFDNISDGSNCSTTLPKEVLSATIVTRDNMNIFGRITAFPFTWPGKVLGVAGRTVGGTAIVLSNASEGILNNFGNGTNELLNGHLGAAGRSYWRSVEDIGLGVYDSAYTIGSGLVGIVKESGDEIVYVVNPSGDRVAQINPDEVISIAFACNECK